MLRSSNPALKDSTFLDLSSGSVVAGDQGTMSLNGTVNKTGMLLLMTVLTAAFAWSQTMTPTGEVAPGAMGYLLGGGIGGFILAMVTIFKKEWSPVTAPLYALVEGLFLGAISAIYNAQFQGIVLQAVMLTFGIMFALLFAYRSGLIKATENFKLGVAAATGGIALIYIATIVLGLFGIKIPFIHDSGLIGIGFSLFVVVVASLNLVMDFDFIESGVEAIVMNASGCGVTVKEYGHTLADDPAYAAKAKRISELTKDLSELLPALVPTLKPKLARAPDASQVVGFHPPCTLQHGQQLKGGVEQHLSALGFTVMVANNEAHLCCGSAGTYSVLQPELSYQLRDRKLGHLNELKPAVITSANIGCITHLQSGTSTPVRHWIEVLDDALA